MKVKFGAIMVAMMAVTAPAWAGGDPVGDLAQQTGLSERQVRMVIGNRTPYAEYRIVYDRSVRQLKAHIGEGNYQRLMSGEPVVLPNGKQVQFRVAAN